MGGPDGEDEDKIEKHGHNYHQDYLTAYCVNPARPISRKNISKITTDLML